MDFATTRRRTLAEFLEWEERQEEKYEFDGEQPVLKTGGTLGHNVIACNILVLLIQRLKGTGCRPYFADIKVTPPDRSRYPDVIVSCSPVVRSATVETAPVVIFEVLSPSTSHTDRRAKNAEYRSMPTVRRYVMVEQDRVAACSVHRADAAAAWVEAEFVGAEAVLEMPEIGVRLSLGAMFEGLALD